MIIIAIIAWLVCWACTLFWMDRQGGDYAGWQWFAGPVMLALWPLWAGARIACTIKENLK